MDPRTSWSIFLVQQQDIFSVECAHKSGVSDCFIALSQALIVAVDADSHFFALEGNVSCLLPIRSISCVKEELIHVRMRLVLFWEKQFADL
jgi:hypothetical protein